MGNVLEALEEVRDIEDFRSEYKVTLSSHARGGTESTHNQIAAFLVTRNPQDVTRASVQYFDSFEGRVEEMWYVIGKGNSDDGRKNPQLFYLQKLPLDEKDSWQNVCKNMKTRPLSKILGYQELGSRD